jgi:hypothetical protein
MAGWIGTVLVIIVLIVIVVLIATVTHAPLPCVGVTVGC